MFTAQRPRGVRLGVDFEANALIAALGAGAYAVACARAQEASSDDMAKDWRDVANAIARRTRRRAGLLAAVLH
jgi:hypothetical protein